MTYIGILMGFKTISSINYMDIFKGIKNLKDNSYNREARSAVDYR